MIDGSNHLTHSQDVELERGPETERRYADCFVCVCVSVCLRASDIIRGFPLSHI